MVVNPERILGPSDDASEASWDCCAKPASECCGGGVSSCFLPINFKHRKPLPAVDVRNAARKGSRTSVMSGTGCRQGK